MKKYRFLKITLIHFMILICVFIQFGCAGDGAQDPSVKAEISIVSGNNQTGEGGERLDESIVVRVTKSNGSPANNIDVNFRVVEGGGRIESGSTKRTDGEGNASADWIIGSGYNGIEVTLLPEILEVPPVYVFAEGENPTGVHETKTICSLIKISDYLYEMTFTGDYNTLLNEINQNVINNLARPSTNQNDYYCSLFSAFGNPDAQLFGRSFDNPSDWEKCISLIVRCKPPEDHESITLVRMIDVGYIGYLLESDITALTFEQKKRLLETIYIPPDGLNEHGVVAGLAQVSPLPFQPDPAKESIYKTRWIREILDHASNVDEAIEVTRQYNVFEDNLSSLANHVLVADPTGRSVILELNNGVMQVIPMSGNFQLMTNTLVYNKTDEALKRACSRYNYIHSTLDVADGFLDVNSAFHILQTVGVESSEWSAVYSMTTKEALVVNYMDFENIHTFSMNGQQ